MKILWVFAHPEKRSLNGSLMADGLRELAELGHETRVSDLYSMGWNPVLGAADVCRGESADRLFVGAAQECAHVTGELSDDIRREQDKISWADAVVLQFPLWWFGPPAVLKGWFDRVFVQGFAFGVRDAAGRIRRYGDGGLAGKRALVITSLGARESALGPRGIHGSIEEILFPVLHGTLWYTGMSPLPPFVVHAADHLPEDGYGAWADALRDRLRALPTQSPIPYRHENGGDYDTDLVLKPHVARGRSGLGVHTAQSGGSYVDEPGRRACSPGEAAERPLVEQQR